VLRTCDEYSRFHPEDPNPDFIRGLILFEQERLEACWKRFSRALDMLDDEEYFEYRDIAMLITGEALESYELAGKEQRRQLQRLFWLQQDPDPTTEINERFLEHVYRVYQAKIRYTLDSPSIDGRLSERGRALIKFGWPTHMRTTLGGGLSPADGRMEIWNYFIPPRGFTLYFRDEFLNGNYIVPMDYGYSYSAQTLFNAPPITDIIPETILVPGALDVVAFRDSDLACSVFVSFAVDADSLSGATWTWDVDSFVARTAFYDRSGRPQVRGADTLTADALPAHPGPHGNNRTVIRSFELPFDDYLVAFCFEDELGLTQSIHWSETNTVKYLPDELTVSDILFELPHSLRQDAATFSRSGLALTPNPSRAYPPGRTVDTYVEIYNLGLSGLVSDYEVTYSIHPVKDAASRWEAIGRGLKWLVRMSSDPDPALSQTLSRTGTTYTARERLAINIDELAPGNYMLSIAVHDKTTGERAVASKVFTKLDWR
jgi:GWxTD domain-containing protein